MSNNTNALITNNLIAILIHASMCIILYLPSVFSVEGFSGSATYWLAVGIYPIIAFGMYFFAGRLFLYQTKNTLADIFSVIMLAIILFIGGAFWYGSIMFLLLISYYPLGAAMGEILYIFQMPPLYVKIEYMLMFLSPFPSLALCTGMRMKQYAEDYIIRQQQSTLKNKLMSIISNKKQSFILFIALICLAYLSVVIIFVITIFLYVVGIDLG